MKDTKDTTSGTFDETKGRLRSAFGEATGDSEQRRKGKIEQGEGKLKGLVDRLSDRLQHGIRRDRT
jgi:uncharacterized protein YjbJ (UPF0337 family)